eukprot:1578416-Amphidinium_carterae.1
MSCGNRAESSVPPRCHTAAAATNVRPDTWLCTTTRRNTCAKSRAADHLQTLHKILLHPLHDSRTCWLGVILNNLNETFLCVLPVFGFNGKGTQDLSRHEGNMLAQEANPPKQKGSDKKN